MSTSTTSCDPVHGIMKHAPLQQLQEQQPPQQTQPNASFTHQQRVFQSRKSYYDFLLDVAIPTHENGKVQLPQDVYRNILEYLPPFPLHGKVERQSRKCVLTTESCQTDAEGMIQARSLQALPHLQFFRFRSMGFQVGFGITTDPHGDGGIRLNPNACGFLVSTKCFHFGSTAGKENLTTLMDWLLRVHYHSTNNTMGIAVDYQRNQILMNWPNRQETLRLDLPKPFRNKVLYPMVQVWGGSSITVLPERIMADSLQNPVSIPRLPREQSSSSSSSTTDESSIHTDTEDDDDSHSSTGTTAPTTLPLTHSISQDSWCSEWISLCKYRGLPPDNHKRWTTIGSKELKSILKQHRRHFGEIPIVDELDDRLLWLSPESNNATAMSMTTLRTRRAASPHPNGMSWADRQRHHF